MRTTGTIARGIRTPIIKEGDNLVEIVVESLLSAQRENNFEFKDKDVIAVTESILARSQGNYITVDDIAKEIQEEFSGKDGIGVVFPILSRNRFSMILKGIARAGFDIYMQLSYPRDEVGNPLFDPASLRELNINPYSDVLSEEDYLENFSDYKHPYTGINYLKLYKEIVQAESDAKIEFVLANDPAVILNHTNEIIAADIHTRKETKVILRNSEKAKVIGLDDICNQKASNRGYNRAYGLLGSNKATAERLKLFPRNVEQFVKQIQQRIHKETGAEVEVMVYGDGAYKDPTGEIWELADPVVSPGYTSGLKGTPNEVKLKYLADNELKELEGEELLNAMKDEIGGKDNDLIGNIRAQGTTPRQLTDLLGSLSDLVSGSGDKGTPVILIQGYFDNLASD
ncbi:MAG: coenzyme F420-0:L-glutamate ligase [Halarsenatibacteraceae bacterium]